MIDLKVLCNACSQFVTWEYGAYPSNNSMSQCLFLISIFCCKQLSMALTILLVPCQQVLSPCRQKHFPSHANFFHALHCEQLNMNTHSHYEKINQAGIWLLLVSCLVALYFIIINITAFYFPISKISIGLFLPKKFL